MQKTSIPILLAIVGIICFGVKITPVSAYIIENLDFSVEGDIVLCPGKTELWMDKGDQHFIELLISNRTGGIRLFKINIEDFTGSYDPEITVKLLAEEKSPFSLKDYLEPEITEFTLEHGQRMRLPVEISIPDETEPGGLYGAVLVSAIEPEVLEGEIEKGKTKGQIQLISRLGSLFFIRIKGDVLEDGFLKDFITPEKFYEKGPINFKLLFENKGNVHLSPYGLIEIKNLLGKKIDEIELDPWFAMPLSLRLRETKWGKGLLFGRYTATAKINRGYQDIIDEKTIYFWVIPWKIIGSGFIILVIIVWFLKWVFSHFEIRRKPSPAS